MAIKINLPAIEAGVRYQHSFKWSTRDTNGVVTPVDLTAWDAILQIRASASSAVALMDWGTGVGGEITLTGNTIAIDVGGTATKLATFTTAAEYDLILWPTGNKDQAVRLAYGEVEAVALISQIPAG